MKNSYITLPPSPPVSLGNLASIVVADVDGDQRDELVVLSTPQPCFPATLSVLSYFMYNDVSQQWHSDPGQLITIASTQSIPVTGAQTSPLSVSSILSMTVQNNGNHAQRVAAQLPGGKIAFLSVGANGLSGVVAQPSNLNMPNLSWLGLSSPSIYCADLNGDGRDEIFALSRNPAPVSPNNPWHPSNLPQIAVLDADYSQCLWTANGMIPGGQTFVPEFDARVYRVKNGSSDGLLIYNPSSTSWALVTWNGASLQIKSQGTGLSPVLSLSSSTTFYPADVNGDGVDEIVVNANAINVWSNDLQHCLSSGPTPNGLISGQPCVIWHGTNRADRLLNYVLPPTLIPAVWALATWNGTNFTLGAISGPTQSSWPTTSPSTQVFAADVNGDGMSEIVLYDSVQANLRVLRNDMKMQLFSYQNSVTGWGIDCLTAAVQTPLPPFRDTEAQIYAYINQQVQQKSVNLPPGTDIRQQYGNAENKNNFSNWFSTIGDLQNPPQNNWPAQQWQSVVSTISKELSAVCLMWAFHDNIYDQLGTMNTQQQSDVNYVLEMIQQTVPANPPAPPDNSWLNAVVGAMIVGGQTAITVAFPEEAALQVGVAVAGSLLTSVLPSNSANGGSSGGSNQSGTSIFDYASHVNTQYQNALLLNDQHVTRVVTDVVLLSVIGQLLEAGWQWKETNPGFVTQQENVQNANRVTFYQQLLPLQFKMMNWWGLINQSGPVYETPDKTRPNTEDIVSMNAPSQSYWWETSQILFMLYVGSDNPSDCSNFQYPSQAMMNDLFNNLGVPQSNFFTGATPWNHFHTVPVWGTPGT